VACINDIEANRSGADDVGKEIQGFGRESVAYTADVSDLSQVQGLVQASVNELGPLITMVANAGIAQVKALLDLTEQDLRRMFEVNGKSHTTPLSETLLMFYQYTVYTTATPPQPNK
jgi:NAD(P)-dependent dehydrogenase (short-subunit alcohol dehydrogenase family)